VAKLPNIKRISREQFQSAPGWIDQLIAPINTFFEIVYNALNKDINFNDNITCQLKQINFKTTAAYNNTAANFTEITFPRTLVSTAQGLFVLQLMVVANNYVWIGNGVFVNWYDNNGVITIPLISGLAASTEYNLNMMVI
jgi:hypothetical protein